MNRLKNIRNQSLPKPLVVAAGLLFIVLVIYLFSNRTGSVNSQQGNNQIKLAEAVDKTSLDRSFEYPVRDKDGNEVSKIKFTIENASLEKEVIVKGKKNRAVEGRAFVILNLKIQSSLN